MPVSTENMIYNYRQYNHTIIWICSSVRLLPIYSAVSGPIATKLGRKVGDGTPQELRTLVSMENEPLPRYSTKTVLDLSVRPSVTYLLRRFRTDWPQTRQEPRGQDPAGAKGIGFHGNRTVATVFNKNCHVALILGWWWHSLLYQGGMAMSIHLPKMSKIHQAVPEIWQSQFQPSSANHI